jgi:hypothetical protein
VLRLDNGEEYTSMDFSDFCIEAGIKREYIIPYNAHLNGVAERKDKSIVEATKVMMHDQNLPMIMWAEASMTTVYIQNMSPHKILKNMTPKESFTRVKPRVGHFRIFGCSVYFHVPKEKRTKLDPSCIKGTFMGYSESSKAYRIYIPSQRQIEVSRDVTFEEEIAFRRSREYHMKIDIEKKEETIPSPPSAIQRERIANLVVPVDPVDVPRDIAVVQKRHAWARQTLQEVEGHATARGTFRESKRP